MASPNDLSPQADAEAVRRLKNSLDAEHRQDPARRQKLIEFQLFLRDFGMTDAELVFLHEEMQKMLELVKKQEARLETDRAEITKLCQLVDLIDRAMSITAEQIVSGTIVSFIGRSIAVSGDTAYVTALDDSTGERFEAECEASFLRERGIEEGEEFVCTVTRKGVQTVAEFAPLPPKVLSEEDLDKISKEVDSRLK
jgi:hypothetical protein